MTTDIRSSEIAPHPGEARFHLEATLDKIHRFTDVAVARGDEAGAEAWRGLAVMVKQAITELECARTVQSWGAKRTAPCSACKR